MDDQTLAQLILDVVIPYNSEVMYSMLNVMNVLFYSPMPIYLIQNYHEWDKCPGPYLDYFQHGVERIVRKSFGNDSIKSPDLPAVKPVGNSAKHLERTC